MATEQQKVNSECDSGCTGLVTERNCYYTGKYLAARDFKDEQDYVVSRQRLHNRLLHGWGIVCGLEVKHHTAQGCETRWVVVHAGTAVDCCGRELFLPHDMPFELPLPEAASQPAPAPGQMAPAPGQTAAAGQTAPASGQPANPDAMQGPFLIGIAYQETLIDYVPALYADNACDTQRLQANRVREGVRLVCVPIDKVQETCWQAQGAQADIPCRDDCSGSETGGTCFEPNCPCGDMVPLALVTFDTAHPEKGFHLEDRGRKYLAASGELLTHIVHINWPHGGELTLSDLREGMNGELRIRFDRKLLPADGLKSGVNQMTFVVQYGGVQKGLEFLPFPRHGTHGAPKLDESHCEAIYTIDRGYLEESDEREDNIAGNWVYVSLKCDFLVDCHNRAVDGNFLKGRLPTGDGMPGGTFESWFRVISEREREEGRERHREEERERRREEERERRREEERERRREEEREERREEEREERREEERDERRTRGKY